MTPYNLAERWHRALGSDWTFAEIIEAHSQRGVIHSTPEVFVLARRVHSDWYDDEFRDPFATSATGDCWHVWLLAGDFRAAMAYLPEPLPFVSFHRRGQLRILTLDQAARLTKS
jgi:hypothetical protein